MTSTKYALRRPARRRLAVAGAVATGALVLAACGGNGNTGKEGGHNGHSSSASQQSGQSPAPGKFNDADVMFAQMMIPHHEQAVEMSELADSRASDKEVRSLATDIEKAQGPEIKKMTSWLKSWKKPTTSPHEGMDHDSGMAGMMSGKDMKELKSAKGTEFDRKFTAMMVDHHKGAVDMAKDEQKNGRNATAKKLAAEVVKTQSSEIKKLQDVQKSL